MEGGYQTGKTSEHHRGGEGGSGGNSIASRFFVGTATGSSGQVAGQPTGEGKTKSSYVPPFRRPGVQSTAARPPDVEPVQVKPAPAVVDVQQSLPPTALLAALLAGQVPASQLSLPVLPQPPMVSIPVSVQETTRNLDGSSWRPNAKPANRSDEATSWRKPAPIEAPPVAQAPPEKPKDRTEGSSWRPVESTRWADQDELTQDDIAEMKKKEKKLREQLLREQQKERPSGADKAKKRLMGAESPGSRGKQRSGSQTPPESVEPVEPEWLKVERAKPPFTPKAIKEKRGRGKKDAPLPQHVYPDPVRDIPFLASQVDIDVLVKKPGALKWLKDPRSHIAQHINKHYGKKLEIKMEKFGPNKDPLHRAIIEADPDVGIMGIGDARNKKDAERAAAFDACCKLDAANQMDRRTTRVPQQQAAKPKEKKKIPSKQQVIDYCADRGYNIEFAQVVSEPQHRRKIKVEAVFEAEGISAVGYATGRKAAEEAAADDFKVQVEAKLGPGLAIDWTIDKARWTLEAARNFVVFHDKQTNAVPPRIESLKVPGPSGRGIYWKTEIWVDIDKSPCGSAIKVNKKDSVDAAWLNAALTLRQRHPQLWDKFDKKRRGIKPPAPPPTVGVSSSYESEQKMLNLLRDLRGIYGEVENDENESDRLSLVDEEEDNNEEMRKRWLPAKEVRKAEVPETIMADAKVVEEKSRDMLLALQKYESSEIHAKMREARRKLPITAFSEEFITKIEANPVVVLVGQTGCGKTTQLPQIVLDHETRKGVGAKCNILVTQPRRIAAISVADRVSKERGEKLGQTCGYTVRFDAKPPKPNGSIHYCTTGILLRRMHEQGPASLDQFSHVVVDEVHERDMNTDFLLVVLKRVMAARKAKNLPDVKLILMSATIETGLFAEYFGEECGSDRAPIVEVPGRTFPVNKHYLNEILQTLQERYSFSPLPALDDTASYLERELKITPLAGVEYRTGTPDLGAEEADDQDIDLKSVASDVVDDLMEEEVLPDIRKTGGQEAASWLQRTDAEEREDAELPYQLMAATIAHVCLTSEEGAVLVFLPGWEEIIKMQRMILDTKPLSVDFNDEAKYRLHLLHSSIPPKLQQEVFESTKPGQRKIILSTNIAETSVTIDDVVYVVDSGKIKEKRYDLRTRITHLTTCWISESNAKQRAGRAGRVRSGEYYGMMTLPRYQRFNAYSTPEIVRSDLQEICLHIKALDLPGASVAEVLSETIQPPDPSTVQAALANLRALRALDSKERLTPLGRLLATLPVEPSLGRMVLFGAVLRCLDPVLTLAAGMTAKNPFLAPAWKKDEADLSRYKWSRNTRSDHFAVSYVYESWYEIHNTNRMGDLMRFCEEECIGRLSMSMIERVKTQLLDVLCRAGIVPREHPRVRKAGLYLGPPEMNVNSHSAPLLRAIILAGVYPNLAVKRDNKKTCATRHERHALIHPSSVNGRRRVKDNEDPMGTLYAYSEIVRSVQGIACLRETTRVDPVTALLFGGDLEEEMPHGRLEVVMDRWCRFVSDGGRAIPLAIEIRSVLERALESIFDQLGRRGLEKGRRHQQQRMQANQDGCMPEPLARQLAHVLEALDKESTSHATERGRIASAAGSRRGSISGW